MATPTYLKPEFSDLETCVEIAKKLYTNAGRDASYDEFAKIVGNSKTSSYFLLKVNAMRAYGFIEVDTKAERIQITPLGETVAAPNDPSDFSTAIMTALSTFPVFKSLVQKYTGPKEPESHYVENALAKEPTIKKEKAGAWADCFLKSARYAGAFKPLSPLEAALNGIKVPRTFVLPRAAEDDITSELPPSEAKKDWLTHEVVVPGGR